MPTIHTHVESAASDCDGPIERHHIDERRLEDVFNLYDIPLTPAGTFSHDSTYDEDLGETLYTLRISTPTEEGYTSTDYRECGDPCDLDERGQRDHYAEAMGY
jgi:hypothetical protein